MILGIVWWAWLILIALGILGTILFMTAIFVLIEATERGDAAPRKDSSDG